MDKQFNTFIELIRGQFEHGGEKYAHDAKREATDEIFEYHGKNWLFGTVDKYTYRYKNFHREKDLLKIATYQYLIWIKRGFFIMDEGIKDPPIDTNIDLKRLHFEAFMKGVNDHIKLAKSAEIKTDSIQEDKALSEYLFIKEISEILKKWSKTNWSEIDQYHIFRIFYFAYLLWFPKFGSMDTHDTDTKK